MRAEFAAILLMVGALLAGAGCVERKMLIRSEPSGAPVWVDEQYVGTTPLDHPFAHYGVRRIRVGPIRDEHGKLRYDELQREELTDPPWYGKFPIDFLSEVLYPVRLTDDHVLDVFVLKPVGEDPARHGEERVQQVRERAEAFRQRALRTIPEQAPSQ